MTCTNLNRWSITEVPLRSLNLLGQEVQLLADYTTHACRFMSQEQYEILNTYLRQLHSEVSTHRLRLYCGADAT